MNQFASFENLNTLFTAIGNKLRGKPTAVELTQAQYDALTPAQKLDTSKQYFVTDAPSDDSVWGNITGDISDQEDLQELLDGEIDLLKDTVGWTGKNLIPYPYLQTTKTINRVTFTDNADGTITVDTESSGASAFSQFMCHDRYNTEHNEFFIPNGTYILSGCPSGGSSSSYRMGAVITKNGTYKYLGFDTGSSVEVTVNGDDYSNDGAYLGIVIDIASGTITSNKVFKPMLRFASINDATYEPYHKPVSEWAYTRSEASILGAKNLLPYPYPRMTTLNRGITWFDKGDGGIIGNGTNTTEANQPFCELNGSGTNNVKNLLLKAGVWYTLSCVMDSQYAIGANIYFLDPLTMEQTNVTYNGIWKKAGLDDIIATRTTNNAYMYYGGRVNDEVSFVLPQDMYAQVQVRYAAGTTTTVTNDVMYPMLRYASDQDTKWQPFAMSNKTLTDAICPRDEQNILGAKNLIPTEYFHGMFRCINDLYFTVNDDMSITVNGTASANTSFNINHPSVIETLVKLDKNKTYICSDVAKSGIKSTYALGVRYYPEGVTPTTSNGTNVPLNNTNNYQVLIYNAVYAYLYIYVYSGNTLDNITFKPLLRLASDKDNTYYPPAMTNKQLTDNKFSYKDNGVLGAKNLIMYPYLKLIDNNRGIDFVTNNDGSVSFSGTPNNGNSAYMRLLTIGTFMLKAGTYKVSGGSSQYGGLGLFFFDDANETTKYSGTYSGLIKNSSDDIIIFTSANGNSGQSTNFYGYEKTFTIGSDAYVNIQARTVNNSVTSAISGTIYPMLRYATDSDGTYQPYAETNYQLTHNKLSYEDNGVLGAKNLLPYPYSHTTKTLNGVTFTDIGDGTILVNTDENGATADATFEISLNYTKVPLKEGRYILSGCPSGGGTAIFGYQFVLKNINTSVESWKADFGGGVTFEQTSTVRFGYSRINIKSGTVCNNLLFKPMIRLASDPDDTWQPYAMTNRELTGKIGTLAPLASPALTGTPTAPTATAGTNTTQIATTAFVQTAIDTAITQVLSASY